jgi:hypothetical protein
VLDQSSTGCTDEYIDEVHNNIHKDHGSTILETAGRVVLPYGTCWQILKKDLEHTADIYEIYALVAILGNKT